MIQPAIGQNLYQAMIEARGELKAIAKTAVNPHFKNRYAPLGEILSEVVPTYARHGVAIFAVMVPGPALSVRAVHAATGELAESVVPVPATPDPQKMKAAHTYAFRTGLEGLCALELDEDDDGNAAASGVRPEGDRAATGKSGSLASPPERSGAPAAAGAVTTQGRTETAPARQPNRPQKCPTCGELAVFPSNRVPGGMYCYAGTTKSGRQYEGCGAQWTADQWTAAQPPA